MSEYVGELPKHVIAQLQEHTAGGYILFRIGPEGDIITDLAFDSETAYLALVKKATSTLMALNTIDNTEALKALSPRPNGDEEEYFGPGDEDEDEDSDEGDSDDEYEEKDR